MIFDGRELTPKVMPNGDKEFTVLLPRNTTDANVEYDIQARYYGQFGDPLQVRTEAEYEDYTETQGVNYDPIGYIIVRPEAAVGDSANITFPNKVEVERYGGSPMP